MRKWVCKNSRQGQDSQSLWTDLLQLVQRVLLLICGAEHHARHEGAQLRRQPLRQPSISPL